MTDWLVVQLLNDLFNDGYTCALVTFISIHSRMYMTWL